MLGKCFQCHYYLHWSLIEVIQRVKILWLRHHCKFLIPTESFFWCHLCKCCPHECHSHFMKVSRPVSIVYPCWKLIGLKSNLWGLLSGFLNTLDLWPVWLAEQLYIKFFLASLIQSPVDNVSSYYAENTCNLRLSFSKWVNQYSFSLTKI